MSNTCAEVDRMPDYKSLQESALLSALLSRNTLASRCKLLNMKHKVDLMVANRGCFPFGSSFLVSEPPLTLVPEQLFCIAMFFFFKFVLFFSPSIISIKSLTTHNSAPTQTGVLCCASSPPPHLSPLQHGTVPLNQVTVTNWDWK